MRNLKKFLALVLAMMMTFSLMITANASFTADSDFSDAESLTPEFREAVSVLEGLEVFEGYEDGTFKPKNNITRAEVATIVYRLATGDVKGTQANLYKDYATFSDVKADHWAAGYINYCANAEWIAGYGNGKFGPNDQVTGYQAASMILRAVGYGKNKEFVGSGWQVQTANFSRSLGLLVNVDDTTYANTLNQAAPRELVAEILFQAGLINTVTWTQLNGYLPGSPVQGISVKYGLAWQNFNLNVSDWAVIDDWGRPGYYWFKDGGNGVVTSGSGKNVVATIALEPALEFNTAWKECDVAHELDISSTADYDLYVNYDEPITTSTQKYRIEATDTVTNVGGQGRVTEFYKGQAHPWSGLYDQTGTRLAQRVVMVDTYLATVTNVTERVLDPAGHVIVPAYLYLDVYDGEGVGVSATSGTNRNTSKHRVSSSTANWEYVKGDKVLVTGWTDKTVGKDHTGSITDINKAAFETNRLRDPGNTTDYPYDAATAAHGVASNISVVQKAEYKTGKQTVTYWNKGMHTVDGSDLNDAMTLFLDVAGTTTNTTYAWYFDEYNNIIGIDNIPDTVNYGVITSIYSAFDQGETATSGTAKAIANVLYANGSTGTITIDKFLMSGAVATGHGTAGTAMKVNTTATGGSAASNSVELVPVYDNTTNKALTASPRSVASKPGNVADTGWLHVAPVINVNAVENGQNNTTDNYFGVLRGNLFKFVASTDGSMTAIEVAGHWDIPANASLENNGIYAGHYNASATATNDKILKNSGYLTYNNTANSVWLEENVAIMVRASATSSTVYTYTLDTLPSDVTLTGTEVDWVDVDGNDRADYVYVTGTTAGTLTYGLFYYNGGAAQWNGVDKNGTLTGWLNGEPATVTFSNETLFNVVKNSQNYKGHLFALELTNGVVTAILRDTTNGTNLLTSTHGTGLTGSTYVGALQYTDALSNTIYFKTGIEGGNPYSYNRTTPSATLDTKAIYLEDNANVVSYDAATRTVTVGNPVTSTYYLTTSSKVYGLGMGVTTDGAILDYLNKSTTNDVTIVYTGNGANLSIVEIYVATDPNVTPPTTGDSSTLSLSYDQVARQFTVNFTNNTGKQLDTVVATVYYRMAGTSNPWVLAGSTTSETVNNTAGNANKTVRFGAIGSTTNFEAYVVVTGVYNGTTTNYTLNTLSNLTYFIG